MCSIGADDTVMQKAGKISGKLISRGEEIDRESCIIGATALLNDEPVVTRNNDHFERIDGLGVETYWSIFHQATGSGLLDLRTVG